ncbi:MAG: DUF4091 domain-containing protein [Planctomycetes bacterium]|nr:DUF4091 domain-containing protein [Planctomycetota bacterium]
MRNRTVLLTVLATFLIANVSTAQKKKKLPDFPPAEMAIKDNVGPWGMPFSDLKNKFDRGFALYQEKYKQAHPDVEALNYVLGIETSLRKVFRNKWWFKGEITDMASISACRNEVESFQIAVMPRMGKELQDVAVKWTGLAGPSEIPKENVTLYSVLFIKTLPAQYPTKHTGYWPDALMPLKPFSVTGLDLGLLWVDVKVPKDAKPGDYTGAVIVQPKGEPAIEVTVKLHVWDFEIPDRIPFPMTVWPQNREPKDWTKPMPPEQFLKYCAMFLEHHIDPCSVGYLYVKDNDFTVLEQNLLFCFERGLQIFRAPRLRKGKEEELKPYYDYIKEKGWLDKCFVYGAQDEPSLDQFNEIVIPSTQKVRELYPGLRVLLATEWHPNLDQGMDIFMTDVSTGFELYGTPKRPRGKEKLWWYFCHLPIRIDFTRPLVEAPNMEIDNDAIEHRMAYWLMWKYDVKGCFIWNGTSWPRKLNAKWPEEEWVVQEKPYGYPYAGIHNGNGYLVYPGPHPSVRLKVLRDGAEDYGYLMALRAAKDHLSGRDKVEAEGLLAITPDLLVDTHYFNRDPQALLDYRAKVARLIEKAGP